MNKLDDARKKINIIDEKMAKLFVERMEAVEDVVAYKIENNMQVLDSKREEDIIQRNVNYINNEKYKNYYLEYFKDLLEISKTYQRRIINKDKIGYQGVEGAFGYIASKDNFPDSELINYPNFEDVIKAVERGDIKYGVIPFENSYTGEVGEVFDLLRIHHIYINKIYDLKIDQNLMVIKGTKMSDIKEIYSHPQALSQSSLFLKDRDIKLNSYANTALAAKYIRDCNDKSKAAIASKQTAKLYDLEILEANIQTSNENTTRFIIISKEDTKEGDHFQLLFDVKNETGTLASVMNLISSYDLNMVSIKSRAIPHKSWEYYFHVEIEGNYYDDKVVKMIKELENKCSEIKYLGTYTKES